MNTFSSRTFFFPLPLIENSIDLALKLHYPQCKRTYRRHVGVGCRGLVYSLLSFSNLQSSAPTNADWSDFNRFQRLLTGVTKGFIGFSMRPVDIHVGEIISQDPPDSCCDPLEGVPLRNHWTKRHVGYKNSLNSNMLSMHQNNVWK